MQDLLDFVIIVTVSLYLYFHRQWAPGYGPLLISKGMNIYTQVGELEPKILLDIFLDFISQEEKKDSSLFLTSLESYMLKKEESAEMNRK